MPDRMRPFFSADGDAALAVMLQQRPLMAFDFDGTLAPIVARPDDARIPQGVATRLRVLAGRLPVAIVTGRALDDVRDRLGFEPQFIVGNHGAEDHLDPTGAAARARVLDALRQRQAACAADLAAAGVMVEDKRVSMALHYRLARNQQRALAAIEALLSPPDPALRVFAGKRVVNVMAADAPDKSHAVRSLVARCGAGAAFYAGDDVNDEPVFEAAPAHWLTVRVGRDAAASHARFRIDGPADMALLLDRVLAGLAAPHPEHAKK
jgi:trehalose 6-phosphate phosphatase